MSRKNWRPRRAGAWPGIGTAWAALSGTILKSGLQSRMRLRQTINCAAILTEAGTHVNAPRWRDGMANPSARRCVMPSLGPGIRRGLWGGDVRAAHRRTMDAGPRPVEGLGPGKANLSPCRIHCPWPGALPDGQSRLEQVVSVTMTLEGKRAPILEKASWAAGQGKKAGMASLAGPRDALGAICPVSGTKVWGDLAFGGENRALAGPP